jgi:hypothetical protein
MRVMFRFTAIIILMLALLLIVTYTGSAAAADDAGIEAAPVHPPVFHNPVSTAASSLAMDIPKIYITDAVAGEGNFDSEDVVFYLYLSHPAPMPLSFQFTTVDGSAKVADNDYQPQDLTLDGLDAGALGPYEWVAGTIGDQNPESHETFSAKLSDPINVEIGDGNATATIIDDDFVTVNVSDATVVEGNAGTNLAVFTVSLSEPNPGPATISVQFTTANGKAKTGDNDYQAQSFNLTFLPGVSGPITVTVPIIGDTKKEKNETFTVKLSNPIGMRIGDGVGKGTITNDD